MSLQTIDVDVTQDVIERAISGRQKATYDSLKHCLIATAVQDQFPDSEVTCLISCVVIDGIDYRLPPEGKALVEAFIGREPLTPSKFTMTRHLF